jgi:hypothetical protein
LKRGVKKKNRSISQMRSAHQTKDGLRLLRAGLVDVAGVAAGVAAGGATGSSAQPGEAGKAGESGADAAIDTGIGKLPPIFAPL